MTDKEIVKKCAGRIEKKVMQGIDSLNGIVSDMKDATTIPEFMSLKKRLMKEALFIMPLGANDCPFCVKQDDMCSGCFYAKDQGRCHKEHSVFMTIDGLKRELLNTIEMYWNDDLTKKYDKEIKPIDYISLHKEAWLRVAETGTDSYGKGKIVREIADKHGIGVPYADCFLCQDTKDSNKGLADCKLCKGRWGRKDGKKGCLSGGYYSKWTEARNTPERKAIALKIAHNCDPLPKIMQVTNTDMLVPGNKYFVTYNTSGVHENAPVPIEQVFTLISHPYAYTKFPGSAIYGSLQADYEAESSWSKDGKYRSHFFLRDYGIPKSVYSDRRTWTYDESVKDMTWGELKQLIKY